MASRGSTVKVVLEGTMTFALGPASGAATKDAAD